jgi:hypothetical protein
MVSIGSAMSEFPDAKADGLRLLQRICARRSTPPRHLSTPGPTDEEIRTLVRAASRAPDHRNLKPFRFFVWICRNSFFPSAGLWPALAEEGEAGCSRVGILIGR